MNCARLGHDLAHRRLLDGGERILCVRDGCGLVVDAPDGWVCVAGAYRGWGDSRLNAGRWG